MLLDFLTETYFVLQLVFFSFWQHLLRMVSYEAFSIFSFYFRPPPRPDFSQCEDGNRVPGKQSHGTALSFVLSTSLKVIPSLNSPQVYNLTMSSLSYLDSDQDPERTLLKDTIDIHSNMFVQYLLKLLCFLHLFYSVSLI